MDSKIASQKIAAQTLFKPAQSIKRTASLAVMLAIMAAVVVMFAKVAL